MKKVKKEHFKVHLDKFFSIKTLIISILIVLVVISVVMGRALYKKAKGASKEDKGIRNSYKAYIAVGKPLVEINYFEICKKAGIKDEYECEDPIVTKYELLNDDAKTVYKKTNLLENGKELISVIYYVSRKAADNGLTFTDVNIYSNWKNLNTYISGFNNTDNTWKYNINLIDNDKIAEVKENLISASTTYKVTFDTGVGTNIEEQEVNSGAVATRPVNPYKAGYTFTGWTLDGAPFDFKTPITKDITLKATYTLNRKTYNSQANNAVANNAAQNTPAPQTPVQRAPEQTGTVQ